ncbi:MAG TPA: hypothetical protein VFR41_08090 [Acidimicrobiia bacterium]|nr:hypothetical protein [Acidimicrobiia bacterium]
MLDVSVRHFGRQGARELTGPGVVPPQLDPVRVREAVERACYSFAHAS